MAIFFALTFYHILTCFLYSSLCYKNNNGTDTRAIGFDKLFEGKLLYESKRMLETMGQR